MRMGARIGPATQTPPLAYINDTIAPTNNALAFYIYTYTRIHTFHVCIDI